MMKYESRVSGRGKWLACLCGLMILVLLAGGCRSSRNKSGEATTSWEDNTIDVEDNGMEPAVAAEVDLPQGAENMRYPIWALLMGAYEKHLPYFTGETESDASINYDSFFYPMSVLTTLVPNYSDEGQETEGEGYYPVSEEIVTLYASTLFNSYGTQMTEAPEINEDKDYARINDSDEYPYSFKEADLTDLGVAIIGVVETEDGYEVTAELRDLKNKGVLCEATFTLVPISFEGEEPLFQYSIDSMEVDERFLEP